MSNIIKCVLILVTAYSIYASEIQTKEKEVCEIEQQSLVEQINQRLQIKDISSFIYDTKLNLIFEQQENIRIINDPDHEKWFDSYEALKIGANEYMKSENKIQHAIVEHTDDIGITVRKNFRINGLLVSAQMVSSTPFETTKSEVTVESAKLDLLTLYLANDERLNFKTSDDLAKYLGSCKKNYKMKERSDSFHGSYIEMQELNKKEAC